MMAVISPITPKYDGKYDAKRTSWFSPIGRRLQVGQEVKFRAYLHNGRLQGRELQARTPRWRTATDVGDESDDGWVGPHAHISRKSTPGLLLSNTMAAWPIHRILSSV